MKKKSIFNKTLVNHKTIEMVKAEWLPRVQQGGGQVEQRTQLGGETTRSHCNGWMVHVSKFVEQTSLAGGLI